MDNKTETWMKTSITRIETNVQIEHRETRQEQRNTCSASETISFENMSINQNPVFGKSQESSTTPAPLTKIQNVLATFTQGQVEEMEQLERSNRSHPDIFDEPQTTRQIEQTYAIMDLLGIRMYFPAKLSVQEVMRIGNQTYKTQSSSFNIIRYLKRLIMLDYTARDNFEEQAKHDIDHQTPKSDENDFDIDNFLGNENDGDNHLVHPLDCLLLCFLCCDQTLRQILIQKLFLCRLAIPILYKTFCGQSMFEILKWGLRPIIPIWKNGTGNYVEDDALCSPCQFVLFARVGSSKQFRKSKIANEVLSDLGHPTFFHWDCENGTRERQVSEGLLEGSWYIPAGRDTDVFSHLTMFLNLRGDCLLHKQQMEIARGMASTTILLLDVDLLQNADVCKLIESCAGKNKFLLLLVGKNQSELDAKSLRNGLFSIKSIIGDALNKKYVRIMFTFHPKTGISKNAADIKDELRKELLQAWKNEIIKPNAYSDAICSLPSEIAYVDESIEDIVNTKMFADKVLEGIKSMSVKNIKLDQVPLQGKLWQDWSKLQKAKARPSIEKDQSTFQRRSELQQEMTDLRDQQLALCLNPSKLMKDFVDCLVKCCEVHGTSQLLYFLQWIKLSLDIISRQTLPSFHAEYQRLWSELQTLKGQEKEDSTKMKELGKKVEKAESDLANASFGLEHMMRELGQMYECVIEGKPQRDTTDIMTNILKLPAVVAKLALSGHPLELMDGDAANIPLSWIKAVIQSLKSDVGEKKIFVVSVLGVQSSGKSTLLNTMFGLQFAVSAGRCTRGVYMQLVKVAPETGLPFDYACVIDTEGLRAPELGMMKYDHDNELATLVIGLGDLTIVNIKGENYSEMKDVLQIAVHAFLRMKLVSNYENNHRCIFIHQNVPAANAKDKMTAGCQKLQENLDLMTKEAAEQEKYCDIRTFDQVISFDCLKDVWFFPDLWQGDPPMAPANPGYHAHVNEVRKTLFTKMANKQKGFILIEDLGDRIKDLWQGIMADDFVFSFRNSLEMKAYNGFEKKFQKLSLKFEEKIMVWEKDKAKPRIRVCETKQNIDLVRDKLEGELDEYVSETLTELTTDLTDFCKSDSYADIIVQWQQVKINDLAHEAKKQTKATMDSIDELFSIQQVETMKKKDDDDHKADIMRQACQLAEDMKKEQKEFSSEYLRSKFDGLWTRWIKKLAAQTPSTITSDVILRKIEKILFKRLSTYRALVSSEIRRHPIDGFSEMYISDTESQISPVPERRDKYLRSVVDKEKTFVSEEHFSIKTKKGFFKQFTSYLSDKFTTEEYREQKIQELKQRYHPLALNHIEVDVLHKIKIVLNKQPDFSKFDPSIITQLISVVLQIGEQDVDIETEQVKISFLPNVTAILAVHACRCAFPILCEMQELHEASVGYLAQINSYKETLFKLFENTCKERGDEVLAADLFCDHVKALMKTRILDSVPAHVKLEVRKSYETKMYILQKVLKDLAIKKSFSDYTEYILDPMVYVVRWIEEKENQGLLAKIEMSGKSVRKVDHILFDLLLDVSKKVHATLDLTQKKSKGKKVTLGEWIKIFCENAEVNEFAATPSSFPVAQAESSISRILMVSDSDNFDRVVRRVLKTTENDLMRDLQRTDLTALGIDRSIYKDVISKLWGCKEACPYCKEPCLHTQENHPVDHRCLQHRPDCIGGFRWWHGELSLETCNYNITTDWTYGGHKFKDYKTVHTKWDIRPEPDNKDSSKYWLWFLARYVNEYAEYRKAKAPKIPTDWTRITEAEATGSLDTSYAN